MSKQFYHRLNWGWRGIKMSIGTKTIITFFLILLIPITGIYFALTNSIKNFLTNEYIEQTGNQIRTVNEIFEKELSIPGNLIDFLTKSRSFKNIVLKQTEDIYDRLENICSSINAVNITFIYNSTNGRIYSSNRIFNNLSVFQKQIDFIKKNKTAVKSYEIIPFEKSLFTADQLSIIGNIEDKNIIVYLKMTPFNISDETFIIGNFIVLNNNKSIMDKIYNNFTYNTALFSAVSFREKIIATNSTPKNIFF